jgi:hypothetical protein
MAVSGLPPPGWFYCRRKVRRWEGASLGEQIRQIDRDREIRVVVIRGAGEQHFTAGADVREMAQAALACTGEARGPFIREWLAGVGFFWGCNLRGRDLGVFIYKKRSSPALTDDDPTKIQLRLWKSDYSANPRQN